MKYICMTCRNEYEAKPTLIKCECGAALWLEPQAGLTKDLLIMNDFTMWRYSKAYPIHKDDVQVTFNETITPLAETTLSDHKVFVKMDSLMPTGSFKARGAAMVINYLKLNGISSIAEDSSGNGGSAYAGYAAKGGLDANIFVPAGTSEGKTAQTRAYGARCIEVEGTRETVADTAINSIDTYGSYYVGHNWHPLFIEGVKSIAYEIWEQNNYKTPDNFVVPAGNGSLLAGAYLGFKELLFNGEINKLPRLFGVQTEVIKPFVQVSNGEPINIESTDTIAEGIKIQKSSRINEIVEFVKTSNGSFVSVSDEAIKATLLKMGNNGFFIEPTSAVAFAGIDKLIEQGVIKKGETTVGVVTGHGLKATSTILNLLK